MLQCFLMSQKRIWNIHLGHAFKVCPDFVLEAACNMHIYTCTTKAIVRGTSCICCQILGPQNMQDAMCFAMQFLFGFCWQHCTARLHIECATCLTSGLAIIMPILLRTAGSRWNRTQTHNSTIL